MKKSLQIRPIQANDNEAIAAVIREVMREHGIDRPGSVYTDPTTDQLYELFQKPGSAYFILMEGNEIAGGCGIYPTEGLGEGCAELVKLYARSSVRGEGWGTKLMLHSIESAKAMGYRQLYLESMPELNKAIGLYERLGFKALQGPMGNSGHYACNIWMLLALD
jgi:putative acetyltransferase